MYALLTLLLLALPPDGSKSGLPWMYSHQDEWTAPPAELQKTYLECDSEIVLLYPNGKFAWISTTLFRIIDSGEVSVCLGCGFTVRQGRWSRSGEAVLEEQSTWTHLSFRPIGQDSSYRQDFLGTWKVREQDASGVPLAIALGDKIFSKFDAITNPEALSAMLAAD